MDSISFTVNRSLFLNFPCSFSFPFLECLIFVLRRNLLTYLVKSTPILILSLFSNQLNALKISSPSKIMPQVILALKLTCCGSKATYYGKTSCHFLVRVCLFVAIGPRLISRIPQYPFAFSNLHMVPVWYFQSSAFTFFPYVGIFRLFT